MAQLDHFYVVILAGGSGTRFWPLSREAQPKQFLNLIGGTSLFQQTLQRVKPLLNGKNVLVVSNARYKAEIIKQSKKFRIPVRNILLEPSGKNTAPAVAWAAAEIHKRDPRAVMAVLPSDHFILHEQEFQKQLLSAYRLAKDEFLVTLGIVPHRPETGYGYLKIKRVRHKRKMIHKVMRFIEKPSLPRAKRYMRGKHFLWNSGMFVWKSQTILEAFQEYLPAMYKQFKDNPGQHHIRRVWPKLQRISIDYGILEKARNVATVPSNSIGWSDLGSWEALAEMLHKDKEGNIVRGPSVMHKCTNTVVWSDKKVVAAVGLDDIIIVERGDALLVCRRDMSQQVKDVVQELKLRKKHHLL